MLKFKQKTESEREYHSCQSEAATNPVSAPSLLIEEKASLHQQVNTPTMTTAKPSRMGIPFARRNLFGIEWSNVHPQNLRNIRLKRLQRPKFLWTRSRKIAAVTLGIVSLVTGRWLYATQPPTVIHPPAPLETLPGPNAMHFYAAGADLFSGKGIQEVIPETSTLAEKRASVAQAKEVLELIRQGMAYSYYGAQTNWFKNTTSPYSLSAPTPNFVAMRSLVRLMACESAVLAAEGKHAAALSASLDAVQFGQHIGQDPALISAMIGVLCRNIGSTEALQHIDQLTGAEAREAGIRMERLILNENSFPQIVENERLFVNGIFDETFKHPLSSWAQTLEIVSSDNFSDHVFSNLIAGGSILLYTKQGMIDAYNSEMDKISRQAALPFQQARYQEDGLKQGIPLLIAIAIPHFQRAHQNFTRNLAMNRVVLGRLAVQEYRQDHKGAYPKNLENLTIGINPYLTLVPTDPFSPTGTDPLRYTSSGLVYSVGVNGKDEGGGGDDTLE